MAGIRHVQFPGARILGFSFIWNANGFHIIAPYWSVTVVVLLIAAVPCIEWRFSLRTLLIATTLFAAVVRLVVAFR
jgi:hypothetical protein